MATLASKVSFGAEHLPKMQADYRAAKRSTRLRPRPSGVPDSGASADYHYRSEADHLWMGELGMEMDRNNVVGQRILDVQTKNVLQDGFQYDPQTGDEKLDADLRAWWQEFSEDATRIDAQGQFDFHQLTTFVYRAMKAAGDIFGLLRSDGSIELAEFYRCRAPSRKVRENIVGGIELGPYRQRLNAWFTKEAVSPLGRQPIAKDGLKAFPFYSTQDDLEGSQPRVLQVFDPKRCTQTRGVTGFAPIFDFLGMHDDLQFVQLVKAQESAMVLLLRQRGAEFDPMMAANMPQDGSALTALANEVMKQELRPGAQIASLPGERLELASANIPNAEFFQHMKLILSLCGTAFFIPLVQLMLDASETNFSGYRGAISEARLAFKVEQSNLVRQWHRPIIWFELDKLADANPIYAKARDGKFKNGRGVNAVNLYRHRWKVPRWAYIQPAEDAAAALLRRANMLTSPRRQCTEDGVGEWDEIFRETVDDHFSAMDYAYLRAAELIKKHGLKVDVDLLAMRLAPLPNPERTQVSISGQGLGEPINQPKTASDKP